MTTINIKAAKVWKALEELEKGDVFSEVTAASILREALEAAESNESRVNELLKTLNVEHVEVSGSFRGTSDAKQEPVAWQGLTDEEVFKCLPPEEDEMAFARAIEAKLREKNRGVK